jgi:hypothetical protein
METKQCSGTQRPLLEPSFPSSTTQNLPKPHVGGRSVMPDTLGSPREQKRSAAYHRKQGSAFWCLGHPNVVEVQLLSNQQLPYPTPV